MSPNSKKKQKNTLQMNETNKRYYTVIHAKPNNNTSVKVNIKLFHKECIEQHKDTKIHKLPFLLIIFKGRFRLIPKTITVIKNLPRTLVFIAKCCNSCLSCRRSNPWTNNSRDVCYLRVVISSMKSTQVEELVEAGKHSK